MEVSDIRGPHPKRGIRVPERSLQAYYPELARIGAETRIEAPAAAGATSHFS
jgi:hypothetical protein